MRLTGEVLVSTQSWISPRIVAAVGNAPILTDPNQTVRAIVQLWLAKLALPVPVAVLDVANHSGLGLARIRLLDLILPQRRCIERERK